MARRHDEGAGVMYGVCVSVLEQSSLPDGRVSFRNVGLTTRYLSDRSRVAGIVGGRIKAVWNGVKPVKSKDLLSMPSDKLAVVHWKTADCGERWYARGPLLEDGRRMVVDAAVWTVAVPGAPLGVAVLDPAWVGGSEEWRRSEDQRFIDGLCDKMEDCIDPVSLSHEEDRRFAELMKEINGSVEDAGKP